MENHILIAHLKTSQIPYLCTLYHYKCLSAKDQIQHCDRKRHKDTVAREAITDCTQFLIKNATPYVFGYSDYFRMEQAESRDMFSRRSEAVSESRKCLPKDIEQCFSSGFFDAAMCSDSRNEIVRLRMRQV